MCLKLPKAKEMEKMPNRHKYGDANGAHIWESGLYGGFKPRD